MCLFLPMSKTINLVRTLMMSLQHKSLLPGFPPPGLSNCFSLAWIDSTLTLPCLTSHVSGFREDDSFIGGPG